MSPEITTQYRKQDPDCTRRRHAFWRNVIGPQLTPVTPESPVTRCLEPRPTTYS